MPPRIAIYGTGAVGSVYAHILTTAGAHVTAICRSNYTHIKSHGITIEAEIWDPKVVHCTPHFVASSPQDAASQISAQGEFDYVLVTAKALPAAKNALAIKPLIVSEETAIVLAQNGIGIEEEFRKVFPRNPILSCAVYIPVTQTSPGHVSGLWTEWLEIGTFPASAYGSDPRAKAAVDRYVELHKAGGGNAVLFEDVQPRRWEKLLLNATWNPMCALTLCRETALLGMGEEVERVLRGVQGEVVAIANGLGYSSVNLASGERNLDMSRKRLGTKGSEPSMLTDILHGRQTEFEVIIGNPIRLARKLGLDVPRMEMLYVLMSALDQATALREPGKALGGDQITPNQKL